MIKFCGTIRANVPNKKPSIFPDMVATFRCWDEGKALVVMNDVSEVLKKHFPDVDIEMEIEKRSKVGS